MAGKILIVGANRGIGLCLMKAFAEKKWTLFGSVRPQTLKDKDPSVKDLEATGAKILEIDFLDEPSIFEAAKQYGSGPLDILINCGGVPVDPVNFQDHTQEILLNRFGIMTVGPYLATKAFLPNLEKSPMGKVINISSDFGSIGRSSGTGGFFGYRMAKAALNQFAVTLANELKVQGSKIVVLSINPGFVATRLTNWDFDDNIEETIPGVVSIIDGADSNSSGRFFDWNGKELIY
jgi:NAD(P)-dependent dehydrogenase (short-subunit alcohol dehydrogenase family)